MASVSMAFEAYEPPARISKRRKNRTVRESEITDSCKHTSIIHDICMQCNQIVNHAPVMTYKGYNKTLLPELQKYDFPDEIKNKADEIFQKMDTSIRRGHIRDYLIFYCIYNAYHELQIHKDPKQIALSVGIDLGEITKALSKFSESQEMYQAPMVITTPLDLIPEYCRMVNLSDDTIENVIELAKEILEKDPELMEGYPQKVAAGILRYFLTINGVAFRKNQFAEMLGLSEVTINNMYKKICAIHNS